MDCHVAYRTNKLPGSSSESEKESGDESDVWKRSLQNKHSVVDAQPPKQSPPEAPAVKQSPPTQVVGGSSRKRKASNIWSNFLAEDLVSSELGQIGLKSKPINLQDRSCENYDFRLKYSDPRPELDMDTDDESSDGNEDSDEISNESAGRHKFKKYRKTSSSKESLNAHEEDDVKPFSQQRKGSTDYCGGRFPKLSPSDTEVARKIIRSLAERKHYLIYRVVHIVGAEKAMKLLRMTEDIEEQGGMLIKNNKRRRTPGGVYLQLLKTDKDISSEQVDQIFAHEIPFEKLKELRKQDKKLLKQQGLLKRRKKKNKSRVKSESMQVDDIATAEGGAECMQAECPQVFEDIQPEIGASATKIKVEATGASSDIEDGEIVDT